jgi:anti-sigma regulatory factor (Ser/Thr protein kinase)
MEALMNGTSGISGAPQEACAISHPSDIAATRRSAVKLAQSLGFDDAGAARVALIVTEAATNILKHAVSGKIILKGVARDAAGRTAHGMEILALDRGPGIANLAQSLRDGVSSAGTAGTGLGAMRRLSEHFDVYSAPGKGSAFFLCAWSDGVPEVPGAVQIGAVCLPMPGEEACGDACAVSAPGGSTTVLVADGLGHGPEAARASATALRTLAARPGLLPGPLIDAVHAASRSTRGMALAAANIPHDGGELVFAGVGNITACLISDNDSRQLMSHNGTVGHNVRKIQEFKFAWPKNGMLILYSDGVGRQWDLDTYPGLAVCHPSLIAGVLYRDHARDRDDACVLVAKGRKAVGA